jgi:succinoglycan biosynthesis protein ExoL
MRVAYFVHDLSDAAVERRVRMLAAGGATVMPIGFRRSPEKVVEIAGIAVVELGKTYDSRLASRAASVAAAFVRTDTFAPYVRGADVIIARNLEMLVLANRARKLYAPHAAMIYECLDIHRTLLSKRPDGHLLRLLETRLWRHVDLLLTSSPAFVRNYFEPRGFRSPIRIVENKVLGLGPEADAPLSRPAAKPPWRIGWFGMIRCRRSLNILASIARSAQGAVEIIIRGRPSTAVFPDFDALIDTLPHVRYLGPYRNPDLPTIYGEVHFNWAVDYYESGQNSSWLLPNRIYEGTLFGAVPIALAAVEAGNWLAERGIGVLVNGSPEPQLSEFFHRLDSDGYFHFVNQIAGLPRASLMDRRSECRALVTDLTFT